MKLTSRCCPRLKRQRDRPAFHLKIEKTVRTSGATSDSDTKKLLIDHFHRPKGILFSALDFAPPSSALVQKRRIAPVVFDPSVSPPDDADLKGIPELLQEIALVLSKRAISHT